MIRLSTVNDLFDTVGAEIKALTPFVFIHADQEGPKPARPYGVYKIIYESVDSQHQNARKTIAAAPVPPYMVLKVLAEASRATVSVNFVGDTPAQISEIREWARKTLDWFRWNKPVGYVVKILNPNVEDRSVYLSPDWEYKLGFDIRLDSTEEYQRVDYELRRVTLKPTIDGDPKPDLIIDKP